LTLTTNELLKSAATLHRWISCKTWNR